MSEYALGFGSVAEMYERARPLYAEHAVDWIVQRLSCLRVLDLAAGTGKLSRRLAARGIDVVAVEPDPEMRAVFRRVLPDIEIHAGFAEAIPLPDASVDAITVGQAFHWFDVPHALAEMHRIVRPGGGIALLWNTWAEEDPLLAAIDAELDALRPPQTGRRWRDRFDSALFGPLEERSFCRSQTTDAAALAAWASTTSGFVNAPADARATVLDRIGQLAGDGPVEVSIGTEVVVADRRDRY